MYILLVGHLFEGTKTDPNSVVGSNPQVLTMLIHVETQSDTSPVDVYLDRFKLYSEIVAFQWHEHTS